VSKKYGGNGRLLASFFFYRNTNDRSKMARFAVTLASQMVATVPATRSFVKAAVRADPALLTRGVSLATQLERLVYKPFRAAVKRGLIFKTLLRGPFLVVIDGLDECEDKVEVKEFIEHLLAFFKRYPSTPLRFFITSRVEQHIKECLSADGVRLDDLVAHGSDDDILTFLRVSFSCRAERDMVLAAYIQSNGQWPTPGDMNTLVRHIGGSFIFASALFKYIVEPSDDGFTPMTRLPLALNMNPGLDGLYTHTLTSSQRAPHFFDVISTIALLFGPLPVTGIAELLGIQTFEVLHVLVNLQSIIHIPGTDEQPISFCHTSLRDFLTTESRSGPFFAPPSHHGHILYRCSLLRDKQISGTAAALYSNEHYEAHCTQFARSPPSPQGSSPRHAFPRTLDDFYAHYLSKPQNLPYFSDIISTLAFLHQPLPIDGIAELLGIEVPQVSRVLINLRAIINIPSDKSPVSYHSSLREFLTTESRSGCFFAPPSFHLRLVYSGLILVAERRSEGAAASYSALRFDQLPHPQTVDTFCSYILAKAQHLPHFSDIISIIALHVEPLSTADIAELLAIESLEVVRQVLETLHPLLHIPATDGLPVSLRHTSFRDFLGTESRSGPFYVSPSYHLTLSYRRFSLNLKHLLSNTPSLFGRYSKEDCQYRWDPFLNAAPEHSILAELMQLPHLPFPNLSYHLFSFSHNLLQLFGDQTDHRPQQPLHPLTKCIESLALAVECDTAPDRWLHLPFYDLGFDRLIREDVYYLKIRKEQATALQRDVECIAKAIKAKVPLCFL
jgi:hypothetical protein